MPNIVYPNSIVAGDAVLATVVSNNLTAITAVVNASNLDSVNYGVSSVQSSNITTNAILSQHISNSQVVSAKISNSQIVHAKMNYQSTDSGARIIQVGEAASDLPANGVIMARITGTASITSGVAILSFTHQFSDALDGGNPFTDTPVMLGAPAYQGTAAGPRVAAVTNMNSASAAIEWLWSGNPGEHTFTWHMALMGTKTS